MFVVAIKTTFVEALKATFTSSFPNVDFRNIWISMEYPIDEANYPGIWVNFTLTTDVQTAGIGHIEITAPDSNDQVHAGSRWRFGGMVTLTLVALTSLARDRLLDAVVGTLAFGSENPATSAFRDTVEHADLVGIAMQWDKFAITGQAETPGTPWGTDDILYEVTVTADVTGEFVSDGTTGSLVPLRQIVVYDRRVGEPDTTTPDVTVGPAPTGRAYPVWSTWH